MSEPSGREPPDGHLRPTGPATVAISVMIGLVAGWLLHPIADRFGNPPVVSRASVSPALVPSTIVADTTRSLAAAPSATVKERMPPPKLRLPLIVADGVAADVRATFDWVTFTLPRSVRVPVPVATAALNPGAIWSVSPNVGPVVLVGSGAAPKASDLFARSSRPEAFTTTPTGTGGDATVAIHHLLLGDTEPNGSPSATAWKHYGFNIDGKVSETSSVDLCKPATGGKPTADAKTDGSDVIGLQFILPWTEKATAYDASVTIDDVELIGEGGDGAPGTGMAGAGGAG